MLAGGTLNKAENSGACAHEQAYPDTHTHTHIHTYMNTHTSWPLLLKSQQLGNLQKKWISEFDVRGWIHHCQQKPISNSQSIQKKWRLESPLLAGGTLNKAGELWRVCTRTSIPAHRTQNSSLKYTPALPLRNCSSRSSRILLALQYNLTHCYQPTNLTTSFEIPFNLLCIPFNHPPS